MFHGAFPLFHILFISNLSFKVSIGFQNPLCLKATSCLDLVNLFIGKFSQIVLELFINLKIFLFKTKKPPLIHSLDIGFSEKFVT